jgi:hypothetical protein
MDVAAAATSVTGGITASTSALTVLLMKEFMAVRAKQTALIESINKLGEASSGVQQKTIKEAANIKAKYDLIKEYGPTGQTVFMEQLDKQNVGFIKGRDLVNEATKQNNNFFIGNNHKYETMLDFQKTVVEDLSDENIQNINILFPASGTMTTKESRLARALAFMITNPKPTPPLAKEYLKDKDENVKVKTFLAMSKIKDAKLSIPQKVFSKIIADSNPTMPLEDWAKDIKSLKDMKLLTKDDFVGGKISFDKALDVLVDMRFANPEWQKRIHAQLLNEGLLREQLIMGSIELKLLSEQTKYLKYLAMIESVNLSEKINEKSTELEDLRSAVFKQK